MQQFERLAAGGAARGEEMVFWSPGNAGGGGERGEGVPQALAYIHLQLLTMRNSQASHTISIMESESAGI